MPQLNFIRSSIGVMQTVAVLIASIIIGGILSAVHLSHGLGEQRKAMHATVDKLLTLAQGGATNAAWMLDERLAKDVVRHALTVPGVQFAAVTDEARTVLAEARRPLLARETIHDWVVTKLAGEPVREQRVLSVFEQGALRKVGSLSIELDSAHIADAFLGEAKRTIAFTLSQALLIGLLLLWLSSRLVTRPLRQTTRFIADINPDEPEQISMKIPARHRYNELGHLMEHTNEMLERLSSSQSELRRLATRDALTGLPNRVLIREVLESALTRAKRTKTKVGVLYIDLDGFKDVNDLLGHEAGDQLLIAVADALQRSVRGVDAVGRLGGDEFLVVLENCAHPDDALLAVSRVSDELARVVTQGSHQMRRHASIGLSLYPDDGDCADDLMRHSDLAMYSAKASGGATWATFSPDMSAQVEARVTVQAALELAISNGELFLAYQPRFAEGGTTLAGCEALLRWRRDGEVLSAGEFLPVAESSSLIVDIGNWVLNEACACASEWVERFALVPVAINVSAKQLEEADFVENVLTTLERYGLEPQALELEVTETVLMADVTRGVRILGELRSKGIAISVDDFGTGYSSLSYLTRLPISTLKIDRSFISGKHPSQVMLHAIVAMARAFALRTVAEGVETEEQLALSLSEGCDLVQGNLTGLPVAQQEFETLYLFREQRGQVVDSA